MLYLPSTWEPMFLKMHFLLHLSHAYFFCLARFLMNCRVDHLAHKPQWNTHLEGRITNPRNTYTVYLCFNENLPYIKGQNLVSLHFQFMAVFTITTPILDTLYSANSVKSSCMLESLHCSVHTLHMLWRLQCPTTIAKFLNSRNYACLPVQV